MFAQKILARLAVSRLLRSSEGLAWEEERIAQHYPAVFADEWPMMRDSAENPGRNA
jgi:hypothetical protein